MKHRERSRKVIERCKILWKITKMMKDDKKSQKNVKYHKKLRNIMKYHKRLRNMTKDIEK